MVNDETNSARIVHACIDEQETLKNLSRYEMNIVFPSYVA